MRMVETMRAIDADALKKIWCDDCENKHLCEDGTPACYDVQQVDALQTIEAVPLEDYRSMEQTVNKLTQALTEAEPKHGRWLRTGQSFVFPEKFRNYFCSECRFELDKSIRTEYRYCPNCGAKMDEVEHDRKG